MKGFRMSTQTKKTRVLENRRGAALVLTGIMILGLLGMAAIAIDVSMAFAARAEMQRIADSSSLAGASVFLEMEAEDAEPTATARANELALMHTIRGVPVDPSEVTVQVLTDERKVRVWINRGGIATWFANLLGISSMNIGAMAAAQATAAGEAQCVRPFAIPDLWGEPSPDEVAGGDDLDDNEMFEEGEDWEWGDDLDLEGNPEPYQRWDLDGSDTENADATGYGSDRRNGIVFPDEGRFYENDYGRPFPLKVGSQTDTQLFSGVFFPFRMPGDPDRLGCGGKEASKQDSGGDPYRDNICTCNMNPITLDNTYMIEPGNMVGPTFQGIRELIGQDPTATWAWNTDPDHEGGRVGYVNTTYDGPWMESPRVIKVALFDPRQMTQSGMQDIQFNNIALVFLEEFGGGNESVFGRFITFAEGSGGGPGPTSGSTVLYLRLVE